MGRRGAPGSSAYSVSKAGLWMLTRILGQELRGDNISVNELVPGRVRTAMNPGTQPDRSNVFDGEWFKEPEEVVPLALFLAAAPDGRPHSPEFQPDAPRRLALFAGSGKPCAIFGLESGSSARFSADTRSRRRCSKRRI